MSDMEQQGEVRAEAPGAPESAVGLERYAALLWDPIVALLTALGRLSGEALAPGQRAMAGAMLADVESIARRAEVLVMSTSPGLLPPLAPVQGPDSPEPLQERRATVMVVDDDPAWLEGARELLSRSFNVLTAGDGCEALELLGKHRPDVVVTDLSMPRTGGLGLLEHARGAEETAQVPFLVLSGTSDTETKVQAFQSGAFDYLTKPASPGELVVRIRKALDHAQALQRERALQETDDLTGLPNRRALRSALGHALREAAKTSQSLAVAMVDQDGLKAINDHHGHPAGDAAIRSLASALERCKRGSDFAARLGGDEFVVVMPGADRAGAEKLAARVQADLAGHPLELPGTGEIAVSACFGVAVMGEAGRAETWEQLLQRADAALYEQKAVRKAREKLKAAPRLRVLRSRKG
ncbi:MAG TPA: diguanylate cyclase [Myxococcales bacterium]|jgi:diguanylate cyclase (GGDEF)-like protein|nr:diguanylate cyclase [Myxococcales bacterium]